MSEKQNNEEIDKYKEDRELFKKALEEAINYHLDRAIEEFMKNAKAENEKTES